MQYEEFVSESAGAKDTWGVNSFQIEGEKGYIYVKDGSNGIAEVRIVTKTTEEIINRQENPDRLFYEVQALRNLFLNDDYETVYQGLAVTEQVMEVLEKARKGAEIYFPGEE